MGKNKFIDKKKSATYQILARDTSDPNYSTGPSSDKVFVRVDNNHYEVPGFSDEAEHAHDDDGDDFPAEDPNSIFADAPDDYDGGYEFSGNTTRTGSSLPDHVRREIIELGFPDDGYNYLSHLREIKNSGGGSFYYQNPKAKFEPLPTDVKAYNASNVDISRIKDDSDEASVYAVASKTVTAKVQKVVDDEIAALLDDSDLSRFGSDLEDLEEDFVVKANLPEGTVDLELDKKLRLVEKPEANRIQKDDFVVSGVNKTLLESTVAKDEKPRARRPLDEQFDLLELQEYGTEPEDEYAAYGASEEDEMPESLAEKLNHALKDHALDGMGNKYTIPSDLLQGKKKLEEVEPPEYATEVIERVKEYAKIYENESEDEKEVVLQESSDESEVWDCETIVSTYSNLDNHPGKIEVPGLTRKKKLSETLSSSGNKIALKGKEKLPIDFLPHRRNHDGDKLKDANVSKPETIKRKQHGQESKEEKKERKASVKEERREARKMKKEIKGLYKSEVQRAQKFAAVAGPSSVHIM